MNKCLKLLGFTLAEIMVVLTVIGVLAGILVPVANHARPDKNVMKFKKADTTLRQVIRELVNSDDYYADGDLSKKKGGENIDGLTNESIQYFCRTISDVLQTKKINCSTFALTDVYTCSVASIGEDSGYISETSFMDHKPYIDECCKTMAKNVGMEILTSDDVAYYQTNPGETFGSAFYDYRLKNEVESKSGFNKAYKIFCIDIDGFDKTKGSENCDDKKDVCPFGYGIRVDGKIFTGARADEWLEKDFQQGKKEEEDE